jgi:hypothetical protein
MGRRKREWQRESLERRCAHIQVVLIDRWRRPNIYLHADDIVIELEKEFVGFPYRGKHISALLNKSLYAKGKIGRKLMTDGSGNVIPGYYLWTRG